MPWGPSYCKGVLIEGNRGIESHVDSDGFDADPSFCQPLLANITRLDDGPLTSSSATPAPFALQPYHITLRPRTTDIAVAFQVCGRLAPALECARHKHL